MKRLLVTAIVAMGFYLVAFVAIIAINGMLAAGLSDQEYGRSSTLAAFSLASKAVLAIVIGLVTGWRLGRSAAAILAGVLMTLAVVLGHLLPGGGLIFSIFADDLFGHQAVAIVISASVA